MSRGQLSALLKALKILIRQGKTSTIFVALSAGSPAVHRSLPRQYKSPERLLLMIQADLSKNVLSRRRY